ncbi:hypothetical protein CPB86DRAFT_587203 [Serendipita vermifera]|nr:hypothetical protein CPB86DRAFT_587203 [Serendipita vermifera]
MSKISTANNPPRNNSINASSAWARGPPASSSPSSSTPQPVSTPATPSTTTPAASNQATGTPRVNGQPSHSRRPSAAMSSSLQPTSTTLKEPVVVNKGVAAPIPSKPSSVQFGSIDDTNAVISSSPAAPSTMTDIKQIKTFGSISAGSGDSSATASTTANKLNGPQRTDSPAPSGKPKKKLDVNSLFQKTQQATSTTPSAPASVQQQPLQQQQPLPNQPIPQPMPQPQQQVPSTPQQSAQDISVARPPPKHQASYDSPSMRNAQLPVLPHQPNQTPSPMQPNAGPPTYHYNPSQPHLRQGGNNVPGSNPPRSPNFPRAIPNGNMRGPPGAPGSAVLGSPRMAPPTTTPNPSAQPQAQTPIPGVPPGVPPGMMPVPGGPTGHPPHMPSPVNSMPPGQMPPQMPHGMQMWGYYYPPVYDPNMPYYWPHQMPPPHMPQPHAPHQQQQTPMPVPQTGLATPSQAPMNMPISPRVPPNGTMQPTPQTPVTSHTPLGQAPPGSRSSFVAPKKAITLKNSAGEEIDIAKLRSQKPEEPQTPKVETARRPVSIRLETEDANKKRREEEEKSKLDKAKREEELAKIKAKRDAEAKERARRDQEEKERRLREAEEGKRKKIEEEEKAKREAEEAEEREKERVRRAEEEEKEKIRKAEEEKERLRIEAEEKEKARLLEIEAQKKAEEEAKKKAEEEAKRKAEEEARQKEEEAKRLAEEAKRKEEEETRLREEAKKKMEEEEAARQKAAEEARLKADAEAAERARKEEEARQKENESKLAEAATETSAASTMGSSGVHDTLSQGSTPLGSTPAYASPAQPASALPKNLAPKSRPVLGPLDLSGTKSANLPQPLPSALASARIIEDIGKVSYPEGIKAPSSELNVNAASGKFRYDRDFLMQFMKVCKEKPDDMPALDAIGLEPSEQQGSFGGRRGRPQMAGSATSSRNSMGLGLTGPGGVPFGGKSFGGGGMGQFQAPAGRSSEERFAASLPRTVSGAVPFPRQTLGRTNSTSGQPLQGMVGRRDTPQRTQSGRGTKRTDSKVGPPPPSAMQTFTAPEPELHHSENAWSALRKPGAKDQTTPEFVEGKVKSLLNKLTMEKFDSISAQILEWANRSVNEVDGRTLIQVIKLVFEKATDEATWSEMYARLCRFLMERISQDVRDEGIKNADGKPIAGGNLFRKYLLNRCQEDFERGWSQKEAAVAAAANKADDDKAVAAAADKNGNGEEVLYSDEYYAAQKAKRRGLGLVKFIGELFKLQMLTERIMHECIKKLLSNVENPEEEEIESLCKLLATVGQALDTVKARNHMDIYFSRMQELANSGQISSRIQFMLLDIIELRSRKWVPRNQVSAPTTIAEVHQKAERDRQTAEREAALRQAGGRDHLRNSRRETRDFTPSQDGWTTPTSSKPPNKGVGDLSNFGKIQKSNTMQFGPSSIFSKKEKRESTSATRNSSSSNMFAALNSSEATPDAASVGSRTANSTRPPSRKGSIDFGPGSVADTPQRRRLMLQPRTVASDAGSFRDDAGSAIGQSEAGDDESVGAAAGSAKGTMSADQAKRKIKEDVKELFMLRQLSEAEGYFTGLPTEFRALLVKELVNKAVDARASDVQLIADVFGLVADKSLVEEEQFIEGFSSDMEYLEDTSTDSPNAYGNIATLMKATKLSQAAVERYDMPNLSIELALTSRIRLADMIIVEGEFAVTPKEKLLKKYAALTT